MKESSAIKVVIHHGPGCFSRRRFDYYYSIVTKTIASQGNIKCSKWE